MAHIFISYSHKDKVYVGSLYEALLARGFDAWIDDRIDYGSRWPQVIEEQLEACGALILVMSRNARTSAWVQNELHYALNHEKKIFPLLLDGEPWLETTIIQHVDVRDGQLPPESFFEYLESTVPHSRSRPQEPKKKIPSLNASSGNTLPPIPSVQTSEGIAVYQFGGIEFVKVPAGPFLMGEGLEQHKVEIPYDFFIGRFPITWAQYFRFRASYAIDHRSFVVPTGKENHPVVNVPWNFALEFALWLTKKAGAELPRGYSMHLPSEAEWEKAARGIDGRIYPWGNDFDMERCNTMESDHRGTTPVGYYSPRGDSPYGAADMAGNVWEWTRSLPKPYPYRANDGRETVDDLRRRVMRGGSWSSNAQYARLTYRGTDLPSGWYDMVGFRIVCIPAIS